MASWIKLQNGTDPANRGYNREARSAPKHYNAKKLKRGRRANGPAHFPFTEHGITEVCSVNCLGSRHKIRLTARGQLTFLNHPDGWEEVEILQALDPAVRCRCQEIAFWWHMTISAPDYFPWNKVQELVEKHPWLPKASERFKTRYGDDPSIAYFRAMLPPGLRYGAALAREVREERASFQWAIEPTPPTPVHKRGWCEQEEYIADRVKAILRKLSGRLNVGMNQDLIPRPVEWLRAQRAPWAGVLREKKLLLLGVSPRNPEGEIIVTTVPYRAIAAHYYQIPRVKWGVLTQDPETNEWKIELIDSFPHSLTNPTGE